MGGSGSGGARSGAGRKRIGISEQQLNALLKAFKVKAKETGKTVYDLIAEIAYNNSVFEVIKTSNDGKEKTELIFDIPVKDRLRAMELFTAAVINKFSQKEVVQTVIGPVIGLPPMKERPEESLYPKPKELIN